MATLSGVPWQLPAGFAQNFLFSAMRAPFFSFHVLIPQNLNFIEAKSENSSDLGHKKIRPNEKVGNATSKKNVLLSTLEKNHDLWNNSYAQGFVIRGRPGAPQRWPSTPVESFRLAWSASRA